MWLTHVPVSEAAGSTLVRWQSRFSSSHECISALFSRERITKQSVKSTINTTHRNTQPTGAPLLGSDGPLPLLGSSRWPPLPSYPLRSWKGKLRHLPRPGRISEQATEQVCVYHSSRRVGPRAFLRLPCRGLQLTLLPSLPLSSVQDGSWGPSSNCGVPGPGCS